MSEARDFRLNRVLSRPLTAFFLKLPLTPNHITTLSVACGVAAGCLIARAGYAAPVAGALFYQLACVLDNCDGEVARAKNMRSAFGARYDLAGDFVVDIALFAGLALGMRAAGGGRTAFVLGGLCVFGNLMHVALVVLEKSRGFGPAVYEAPNARAAGSGGAVLKWFDSVREGDASWVVLVFALIGRMPLFLWVLAVYMQILWASALYMNRRHFGPR